jgi:palmitoyltransferase
MKTIQRDAPKSIPLGEDIMQLARLGESGAMQNMFATKKLTANHRDEEGITPLHVCFRFYYFPEIYRTEIGLPTYVRSERE